MKIGDGTSNYLLDSTWMQHPGTIVQQRTVSLVQKPEPEDRHYLLKVASPATVRRGSLSHSPLRETTSNNHYQPISYKESV